MRKRKPFTTRDGRFTYEVDAALFNFLEAFGQEIQYAVQTMPGGLHQYAHADLRDGFINMYEDATRDLRYVVFCLRGEKTAEIYKLHTFSPPINHKSMDQNTQQPQQPAAPTQPLVLHGLPDISQLSPDQQAVAYAIGNRFVEVLTKAVTRFPVIKQSCERAALALSGIQQITNDVEDKQANDTLVKVRTTYEARSAERLDITRDVDAIKEFLMEPEKKISTDKKSDSQYARVVKLRDGWAQKERERLEKEKAEIKLKQDQANELAAIAAALGKNVVNGMSVAVAAVGAWCASQWPLLTLENIDQMKAKLESVPQLKEETYNGWFGCTYNGQLVSPDQYKQLVADALALYPYATQGVEFTVKAQAITSQWLGQIEAKRGELIQLAELAKTNAEAAAKAKADADAYTAQLAADQQAQAASQLENDLAAIDQRRQDAEMNNAFVAQVGAQNVGEQSGTKTTKVGWLDCPEEEIVDVISKVIYYVFTHPEYKGFYKRDAKTKEFKRDDKGRPMYEDWLATLLNFFAQKCDTQLVPGVKITEEVSTIQKA